MVACAIYDRVGVRFSIVVPCAIDDIVEPYFQ